MAWVTSCIHCFIWNIISSMLNFKGDLTKPPLNCFFFQKKMTCLYIFIVLITTVPTGRCIPSSKIGESLIYKLYWSRINIPCTLVPNIRSQLECGIQASLDSVYNFGFSFDDNRCLVCGGTGTYTPSGVLQLFAHTGFFVKGGCCVYSQNTEWNIGRLGKNSISIQKSGLKFTHIGNCQQT